MDDRPVIIDPEQLRRIESTHRGFLYQHLYAVGTLLLASEAGIAAVQVERDEDIEVLVGEICHWVQVKTRNRPLRYSDIAFAIERYQSAVINQNISLTIISNTEPGPQLMAMINDRHFGVGVTFHWPDQNEERAPWFPPAWATIADAIAWCADRANKLPFGRLDGETLAWKLAAIVQHACTGEGERQEHRFDRGELPALFEQVVIQLQRFPSLPDPYIVSDTEATWDVATKPVRLVVGHSGAGKTAWTSAGAQHSEQATVYFDPGDCPGESIIPSLVRELTGQLFRENACARADVLLPGASGLDSLRALDLVIQRSGLDVVVVLDNVHRVEPKIVAELVRAASGIKWTLLGHPEQRTKTLALLLDIEIEEFAPWSIDTIARAFRLTECRVTAEQAQRISILSGGLPLVVNSLCHMCSRSYDANVESMCTELEAGTQLESTPQDRILGGLIDALSKESQSALVVLTLVSVPLDRSEVRAVLSECLELSESRAAAVLRELFNAGIVRAALGTELVVHDAFRFAGSDPATSLGSDRLQKARVALRQVVTDSGSDRRVDRFAEILRLLPVMGEMVAFLDVVSNASEHVMELGLARSVDEILTAAASNSDLSPEDRFWAADTLAFFAFQRDDFERLDEYLGTATVLLEQFEPEPRAVTALAMKQMLRFAQTGDVEKANDSFMKASNSAADPSEIRVVRYNCAVAFYYTKEYDEVLSITGALISEYYGELQLTELEVFGANLPELGARLKEVGAYGEDCKRLADVLDLQAKTLNEVGTLTSLERIHAHKFYILGGAFTSAARAGMDLVDEILSVLADPEQARGFIESGLLPMIQEMGLLRFVVPVRAQYAVVLAYCGEALLARRELANISEFVQDNKIRTKELENQGRMVEDILAGRVQLDTRPPTSLQSVDPSFVRRGKIGRNQRCPCGSALKYKRCCGRGA